MALIDTPRASPTFVASALLLVLVSAAVQYWSRSRARSKLPPGPTPLPIIGNILDIPRNNPWQTFAEWGKIYGDVIHLQVFGKSIILLNSAEATNDLLEGRFGIYSDRPAFPLIDLVGHSKWNFGFMPYGQLWRSQRRLLQEKYTNQAFLRSVEPSHRMVVARYLQNLLRDPEGVFEHIQLRAGQLIMDVTYGVTVEDAMDPFVQTAQHVMDVVAVGLSPPLWLLNPLAIVQGLPSWMGGQTALPGLQRWRSDLEDMRCKPFAQVKESLAKGTARTSYAATLLQEMAPEDGSEVENTIRDTATLAYGAGFDTAVSNAESFLLAMILYPEIQKKGQEEIDRVVGSHRLPDYSDKDSLPYITAMMKETFRWHPPAPTGIPHKLRSDDVYKGMHIPGGAIVMGNVWGICHDPERYPDPMTYNPERFLREDGTFDCSTNDPSRFVFGFGRRVCPGKYFSEDSSWLMIAQFLATFNITAATGEPFPTAEFLPGGVSRPKKFKSTITPRSKAAAELVEHAARD
ncbi:cytochrome P450 [Lentinus tigrinus ALCF2SS1-7]|uniref:Cytochrome P450 n=1 Tax=Lentinus tigrinus ALCF2SS1-6 TaxID=1328759 RepID=A0A5C2S3A6_9APHY|nr:cytochrome P450 [Lentinus tigrinus ALCF2SS1-6]RPD71985.1 cytochrome P450 [Lentinus tigrinus ALCF2SS1-7]